MLVLQAKALMFVAPSENNNIIYTFKLIYECRFNFMYNEFNLNIVSNTDIQHKMREITTYSTKRCRWRERMGIYIKALLKKSMLQKNASFKRDVINIGFIIKTILIDIYLFKVL